MRYIILALCPLLIAAHAYAEPAPPAAAQPLSGEYIVAVVNDEVISSLDVRNRMALVLATTRLSDTADVRARLLPQILHAMADERLEAQEAARSGITVSDEDVSKGVEAIEAQRGIPSGELLKYLDRAGVPRAALQEQLRAQVAWNKLVLKNIRPKIRLSEEEIDRERSKAGRGGNAEVQIELVTLPVDRPEREPQVKALAEKLVAEIRGGAPFESVAGELGGAAAGVHPIWVPVEQMDAALAAAVKAAQPPAVLEPVRTPDGYALVKLLARRDGVQPLSNVAEVLVKNILLKLKTDAGKRDVDLLLTIGREVARHPGTCADPGIAGVDNLQDFDIQTEFLRQATEQMTPQLKDIVATLPVGGVSEPFATQEGIRLFMLCERVEKPAAMSGRDEAAQRLYQQRLELEAQKYLRGLRREATIDVRLQEEKL